MISAGSRSRPQRTVSGLCRPALLVVSMGAAMSASATPPLFTPLGHLPGGTSSGALGVSANGAVVVGYSTTVIGNVVGDRAFRWSRSTGMVSLGALPGGLASRALAVSANGSVVVGYGDTPASDRAFRWTSGTGMVSLGTLPGGQYSLANDVSDDGTVIVGYSSVSRDETYDYRAFRWTLSTGMVNLGTMSGGSNSYGTAVSANGSVIVGVGDDDTSFNFRAFRRGPDGLLQNLGLMDGGYYTIANAVNADGTAVVGFGTAPEGVCSFRWTSIDGMTNIGRFPNSFRTIARGVSADGSVVVGSNEAVAGDHAFLWSQSLGLVNLNSYLIGRGIDLTGWTLTDAYAISADGLTIVGIGRHNNQQEAWVVFLGAGQDLTPIEQLGKSLMSDSNLSSPPGQSCISCHSASAGFTNPESFDNAHGAVHRGAIGSRFGHRKPPTAAYTGDSPPLHLEQGTWVGGEFFDGRATGWSLGDPLAEQALQPFLDELEQNNPGVDSVVAKVTASSYAQLFRDVWGSDSLPEGGEGDIGLAYERIARSIAAYERSREVNPFNSKYDDYLAGRITLTAQEELGLRLYEGIAGCAACHPSRPGPNGEPPLFTDFTYDNIGIPKNPENPFYDMPANYNPDGADFVDPGLGGFLQQAGYPSSVFGPVIGKHKVPTLRNVDRRPDAKFVRSYGHNGVFKSLEEVVHFYNTRDVKDWPPPEVPQNVNVAELGDLHLTAEEEAAVVTFLKMLTDRDVSPVVCPSDFDRDGFVTGIDFDRFVQAFENGNSSADFDRDGFITGVDFDLYVLGFEQGC